MTLSLQELFSLQLRVDGSLWDDERSWSMFNDWEGLPI
jgi:hypothetical protein